MRPQLQFHRQYCRRHCNSSQSGEIQGIRREIRRGPRLGDGSRQICVRHGEACWNVRSRNMEWQRGRCAMLGQLDRTAGLAASSTNGEHSHDRHHPPPFGGNGRPRAVRLRDRRLLSPKSAHINNARGAIGRLSSRSSPCNVKRPRPALKVRHDPRPARTGVIGG